MDAAPLLAAARQTWEGLVDLLWPPSCAICGAPGPQVVCPTCRSGFEPMPPGICRRCGIIAPNRECVECAVGAVRHFAVARAAGRYEGALRAAVLRLKYRGRRCLAVPLGAFLTDFLLTQPFAPDEPEALVPVPLHRARLASRGYNQSGLLASEIGRALGIPVEEGVLRRIRWTRPQVELGPSERERNMRDAFAVVDARPIVGRTVLLVDDVVTTCHTVNECARVLHAAGARAVLVVSAARGG